MYKNGIYDGSGKGNHGEIKVSVTISDNKIKTIDLVDHNENKELSSPVFKEVSADMINKQSLEVDAISGATITSIGFINAVKDAVSKASEEEKKSKKEIVNLEVDVAVVAAGPAGLSAAVTAAENGLKTVVFEKMSTTGGTANMGMGILGIDTKYQHRQFNDISVADAVDKQMNYTHFRVDNDLVSHYFNMSADTINWLEEMGVEFEGAFPYFKGSEATWHIVKRDDGKGMGPGSAATMNRLLTKRAKSLGVEIFLDTPVNALINNDGVIQGVIAGSENGKCYEVSAKAVIVATGGFGTNAEMIEEELGYKLNQDLFTFNVPGIMGDGLKMMWEAGAQKFGTNIEMIYNLPNNMEYMNADSTLRQPNLLINNKGNRFMNEEYMGNTTYTGNAINLQPGRFAFCIMDGKLLKDYQDNGPAIMDLVHPSTSFINYPEDLKKAQVNSYEAIIHAETLEELSEKLAIPYNNLKETIDRYNKYCSQGKDEEFFKNPKFLNMITGEGGYHVGKYYTAAYGTIGGVRTNRFGEVMDGNSEWIKGLYSAGVDCCTIYGDSYNFTLPGNSMGFAVNSGRMAGNGAVKNIKETTK